MHSSFITSIKSRQFLPILLATVAIGFGFTFVHGYNDDSGILKWNPNWFSTYKYSSLPLGLRGRSYLFKRLSSEAPFGFRWSPSFLYTPFSSPPVEGRKRKMSIAEELNLPAPRNRVLGWYNGPGSSYDLSRPESAEDDPEEEVNGNEI